MGIMKSCFVFTMGTAYGVYVAQNYNVPDVKKLTNTVLVIVEHIEKNYRKPKKDDSCFVFTMGTAYGVYVAQNYNVPDVKKLTNTVLVIVEHIEKNYRKPKKDDVV
ncbi:hypothetical protein F2Q69_00034419 [Brassica cretica]|uniref:Uncharacterized protein n=1 Tax=Brassica cretica TaxID=69181 RepID=A0A8S9SAQ8_BRACR|nr:hypothetical protein F2Q69_00034419 [Brassica cretica]